MRNRESRIDSEAAAVDVAHQPDDAVDGVDADDGGVYVVVCGAGHEITDGFEVFGREGVGVDGRRKDERKRTSSQTRRREQKREGRGAFSA